MNAVNAVATTTSFANVAKVAMVRKYLPQDSQKYAITASIVPLWSMTRSRVISGELGSRPISFSATITWAELDTGNSSLMPCIAARIRICSRVMRFAKVSKSPDSDERALVYRLVVPAIGGGVVEGVSDKRLLCVQSQFASVVRVAGRDGNTLLTAIREAWDSGNLRTLTEHDPVVAIDSRRSACTA